jgi:hypothetical protein
MRRWVCIIALLAGFSGERYAFAPRARGPVPIVRCVTSGVDAIALADWWRHP